MTSVGRDEVVEHDKRYVWHPYTPMQQYIDEGDPLVIDRAQGSRIRDVDGRWYIDGTSSWWTALLGHGHPRLVNALVEQARALCHVALAGATHEAAALLAKELVAVAPTGLTRVFYSDDGSTAVEVAIKLALQYWAQNGRPARRRFLALDGAFHGETLGVTALGGVEVFRRPFSGVLMECVRVPSAADGHEQAFSAVEAALLEGADSIAAVVLEPMVQGAGGMRTYSAEFLRRVRQITRELDVMLVADEVFTGYGRTGPMWACEHAGIEPDVLCVAKGFTAGMLPMAATLATERLFEGFLGEEERALYYGHTYAGHALGARVAREVLAVYRDEDVLARARPGAARIARAFEAFADLPGVAGTRSLGMIGALDLAGNAGYLEKSGWRVCEEARRRGVHLRPLGNVVYVAPPLNVDDATLDELLGVVEAAVLAVASDSSAR